MRKVCILLLLIGMPYAATRAATIIVLGDSLSVAYRIPDSQSWPQLLQKHLEKEGASFNVINASRKGETTSGGLNRLVPLLEQYQPEIVIVALGANDGLRRYRIDGIRRNLVTIIATIHKYDAKPILVGMQLPPRISPDYAESFQRMYHEVAVATGCTLTPPLLDHIVGKPEYFLTDRLHPNAAAQPIMLDTILPQISELMKTP